MSNISLDEITLFDLQKRETSETKLVGDFRHASWERYAMKAAKILMENPTHRSSGKTIIEMIGNKKPNGEVLSKIISDLIEDESNGQEEKQEALEILSAIKNCV